MYFDSSLRPAQFNSSSTKFYQAVASSGAAVAIIGMHSQNWTNVFLANEFAGLAASIDGGSFLLLNASASISLCEFSNNFAVAGASCVDAIGSRVKLSSNTYNFTGRPQNYARSASAVTDDNSMYANGGKFCPIPSCTPALLKDGNCNLVCNISLCDYDGGDCICPIEKCPLLSRGDGVCDIGCATSGCFYDSGDCCNVELCHFNLRNNGQCDQECNNKACGYDGGECLISALNSTARRTHAAFATHSFHQKYRYGGIDWTEHSHLHLEHSHFVSKFRTPSLLMTAVDSEVLRSIESFATVAVGALQVQTEEQPTRFHTKGLDATEEPAAIKCLSSSFLLTGSFIDKDSKNFSTQAQFCPGLSSCGSCDACSRCSSRGCDSSNEDSFCHSVFGLSSKCIIVAPSADNNFTSTSCSNNASAPTMMNTKPNEESPFDDRIIWILVLIGGILCFVGLCFGLRRYYRHYFMKIRTDNPGGTSPPPSAAASPSAASSSLPLTPPVAPPVVSAASISGRPTSTRRVTRFNVPPHSESPASPPVLSRPTLNISPQIPGAASASSPAQRSGAGVLSFTQSPNSEKPSPMQSAVVRHAPPLVQSSMASAVTATFLEASVLHSGAAASTSPRVTQTAAQMAQPSPPASVSGAVAPALNLSPLSPSSRSPFRVFPPTNVNILGSWNEDVYDSPVKSPPPPADNAPEQPRPRTARSDRQDSAAVDLSLDHHAGDDVDSGDEVNDALWDV